MRLIQLHPRFVGAGGEGVFNPGPDGTLVPAPERTGVGISFDCPCPTCTAARTGDEDRDFHLRVYVGFANPLDGGPAFEGGGPKWVRTGDTFETMTLQPSILRVPGKGGCGWHGYVGGPAGDQPGEVVTL